MGTIFPVITIKSFRSEAMREREMEYLKGCLIQKKDEAKKQLDATRDILDGPT